VFKYVDGHRLDDREFYKINEQHSPHLGFSLYFRYENRVGLHGDEGFACENPSRTGVARLMRQLALSLAPPAQPDLENFVAGRNAELLSLLASLAHGDETERFVYIWGAPGCGKTHLLQALNSAFLRRKLVTTMFCGDETVQDRPPPQVVLVDDVDRLGARAQEMLFNVYNVQRDGGGVLLAAGAMPASQLPLREDLVTRLSWGLVYQLHTLTDDEKKMAMTAHAKARGFRLSEDVIDYLLTRQARDLPRLLSLLNALDRYSLENKRAITIPLVRELLSGES
jgi:DnaA family protein